MREDEEKNHVQRQVDENHKKKIHQDHKCHSLELYDKKSDTYHYFEIEGKYICTDPTIVCKNKYKKCSLHSKFETNFEKDDLTDAGTLLSCAYCRKKIHLLCFAEFVRTYEKADGYLLDPVLSTHIPVCGARCYDAENKRLIALEKSNKKEEKMKTREEEGRKKVRSSNQSWETDTEKCGKSSLDVLVGEFLSDEDWYGRYKGGKNSRGKTDAKKKEYFLELAQKKIFELTGSTRSLQGIDWKISRIERSYSDVKRFFLTQTGQGIEYGSETWKEKVGNLLPYYDDLDACFSARHSLCPLYHTEMKKPRVSETNSASSIETIDLTSSDDESGKPRGSCTAGANLKEDLAAEKENCTIKTEVSRKLTASEAASIARKKKRSEKSSRMKTSTGLDVHHDAVALREDYFKAKTRHIDHMISQAHVNAEFQEKEIEFKSKKLELEIEEFRLKKKRLSSEAFQADALFNAEQLQRRKAEIKENPNIDQRELEFFFPLKRIDQDGYE